jgi:subtilisin family serine protease
MHQPHLAHFGLVLLVFTAGCSDGGLVTAAVDTGDVLPASSDRSRDGTIGLVSSSSSGIIEGHYIVVLSRTPAVKDGRADAALEALTSAISGKAGARINHVYRHAVTGFAAELTDEQVEELRRDPRVLWIEKDAYVHLFDGGQVQPYPTWGLDRIDQRAGLLDRAYAYAASGEGVTVYVIDSGIRYSHEEFGGRASLGYDFVLAEDPENTDPNQLPGEDCYGHGTHVAGTVGGGMYGVAKNVSLVSVRVFGCSAAGTPRSRYAAAIDWVTENAVYPAVVNMSLGFRYDEEHELMTETAISNSVDAGINYVVAGGNSAIDACQFSPARHPRALTAGASQINNAIASFSNYGDCLDLYAPGVSITSAWITDDWSGDGSYTRRLSGTSMASPHVAGVVALFLEANPSASPADVHAAIVGNATTDAVSGVPSGTNDLLFSLWGSIDFTPPQLPDLNLATMGLKVQGKHAIDLTWDSPSGGSRVQVFRDESLIAQGWGYGSYRDQTGERGNDATYVHQVCQRHEEEHYQLRENCSDSVRTIFGDGGGDDGTQPPPGDGLTASFDYSCGNSPTCEFTDTSIQGGAAIVSRDWATGSQSASGSPVIFTFESAGEHVVSLTVMDADDQSDQASRTIQCKLHPRHGLRCS